MHQDQVAKDAALQGSVQALFVALESAPNPRLPASIERAIAATAEIIAVGRTSVERDERYQLLYDPEPEGATRLAQQFCQLAKGSARLDGRDSVTEFDLGIVHRVAFDTLNPARASALRAMAAGKSVGGIEGGRTTAWRTVQDLEALSIVTGADNGRRSLTPDFRALWQLARLDPPSPLVSTLSTPLPDRGEDGIETTLR